MTKERLEKIYRRVRIAIFAIPAIVVVFGLYLVLFPIDTYNFYPGDMKLSKFEVAKNTDTNELSFGVFPLRKYRYVELSMGLKKSDSANCQNSKPEVAVTKTYQAFLFPTEETISDESRLRDLLFTENKTKYPNGSLLHLKPTNEVFFLSRGKKILFPGPEILRAFGYSFDYLIDVQQSDIDQFPNADKRVFLWTMPHPDGTIFRSYPSHSLFFVFDGKKYPIANKDLLDKVWPENFTIPVSDASPDNFLRCDVEKTSNKISCRFDAAMLSGIGGYYQFSVKYPSDCPVAKIHPDDSRIRFFSEQNFSTVKESLRNIAASALNRYFFNQ